MKYIDAEKLRAEIERHRQAIRVLNEHTAPEQTSKTCAIFQYSDTILSELLSFLDTLSEEPDKSLEEAAEEYIKKGRYLPEAFYVRPAFIAGANWQKTQMMKKVVEGEVHPDDCEIWVNLVGYGYKFNEGDKVRIIIVKED